MKRDYVCIQGKDIPIYTIRNYMCFLKKKPRFFGFFGYEKIYIISVYSTEDNFIIKTNSKEEAVDIIEKLFMAVVKNNNLFDQNIKK